MGTKKPQYITEPNELNELKNPRNTRNPWNPRNARISWNPKNPWNSWNPRNSWDPRNSWNPRNRSNWMNSRISRNSKNAPISRILRVGLDVHLLLNLTLTHIHTDIHTLTPWACFCRSGVCLCSLQTEKDNPMFYSDHKRKFFFFNLIDYCSQPIRFQKHFIGLLSG
jgi:hypothetical protein